MEPRFAAHNSHLLEGGLRAFRKQDPHLRRLKDQPLVHTPALLQQLPSSESGIYTVGGGRQIGKTTALKQWMELLLERGVFPGCISYFTGELIDDHHALVRLLQERLKEMPSQGTRYLIVDEVTYIAGWDKGIKFLADAGELEDVVLVLTGSDLLLMKDARARFPGRRGRSTQVDFHLHPLSFRETVELKHGHVPNPGRQLELLERMLGEYLIHGGFLTAINDFERGRSIEVATLATYSDWIRGDMLKRGKQEPYLRETLGAIVSSYGSQVSWNSLAGRLSIDHPKTVADYVETLALLDAVFIQPAIIEDKLVAAPKKARKLLFTDPFIFHAVRAWLEPVADPFQSQVRPTIAQAGWQGRLVEAAVVAHFQRVHPTYYIKAEGEVDVAYVSQRRFWPVELKWTSQLRPKDLKQVGKYPNGRIWAKVRETSEIGGVPVEPLVLGLWAIGL